MYDLFKMCGSMAYAAMSGTVISFNEEEHFYMGTIAFDVNTPLNTFMLPEDRGSVYYRVLGPYEDGRWVIDYGSYNEFYVLLPHD